MIKWWLSSWMIIGRRARMCVGYYPASATTPAREKLSKKETTVDCTMATEGPCTGMEGKKVGDC